MQALIQSSLIHYAVENSLFNTSMTPLIMEYDYQTLQEFYRDHILERTYHYYDCDCSKCHAAHFPCDDPDCDYCDSVRQLIAEGYKKQDEHGGIINYAEYNAWPNTYTYEIKDMIYSRCDGCGILVNGYHRDNFDGFCSEECQNENQVFYCVQCGDSEVESENDICEYCENENESEQTDHDLYMMGDIVDEDQYDTVENCWIAPNGNMHYVPYCNHDTTACKLGFTGVSQAERNGWIHVSVYWDRVYRFHYIPSKPTKAQIDTVNAYCNANDLPIPEEAQYTSVIESNTYDDMMESAKMQNISFAWLTMKRSQRDQFYPLSGD